MTAPQHSDSPRPLALFGIAGTMLVLGGMLGASLNVVNGQVSPQYFRSMLRLGDVNDNAAWRASIVQGIVEGLGFGLFFAVVFVAVVGIVSRVRCTWFEALPSLLKFVAGVLVFWVLGGLTAVGLASLSPEYFQRKFRDAPEQTAELLRFAWVNGSNSGAEFGGVLLLVLISMQFVATWRRRHDATKPENPLTSEQPARMA